MTNNWNLLDFLIVSSGWVYILFFKSSGDTGSSTGRGLKPNVFRCIRVLRPLRSLKFFEGLKAVLAALGEAWYLLLEVMGFLCFFFCIFSAMGISLFKGALTYRCEDYYMSDAMGYDAAALTDLIGNETAMDAYFVAQADDGYSYAPCPEHVKNRCMICGSDSPWDKFVTNGHANPLAADAVIELLRASPERHADTCCRVFESATAVTDGQVMPFSAGLDRYDDRVSDVDYYGFDNLFRAVLSEFVATTMDEWPALSHPLTNSDSDNRAMVWPFYATMTLTLAILTANLFVSVICYAFGQLQLSHGNSAAAKATVAQLRAMFNRFDADGSGQIGAEETAAIAETLEIQLKAGELDAAMGAMDGDHQGDVDFQEFFNWWNSDDDLAIRMKRALATEEHRLKLAFKQCDTDKGGSLDRAEVNAMSKVLGISLTEEENSQMFAELDENGDNDVDFGEFTAWWFAGSPTACKVKAAFGGEDVKINRFYVQCVDAKTGEINFATMQNFGAKLNLTFTKPELAQAMEEMDDDQGGTVDEEEFSHWWKSGSKIAKRVRDKLQVEEASIRMLFGRLDDDNSGQVGREEMKIIGDSIGLEMTKERLDTMMGEMDADGSGQVDTDEFLTWWTSNSTVAAELKKALEPFLKKEAAPKFPYIPTVSEGCDKVVTHEVFEWVVLGLVAVNACLMATDRYPMTPDHHNTMWAVELIFCVLYGIEALMKILAVGMIPYFKIGFNKMDFTIVIFSIVGLLVPQLEGAAALRGLRVLVKMLRVLRVFKLLAKYDTVMMLLKTVMGAWKMLINLVVFIVFVLMLFAVAGMHTVGTCHLCTPTSDPPCPENVYAAVNGTDGALAVDLRENYFEFSSAMVTTFQIMSGEDWAPVMYKYMHCAGTPALIFFVLLFSVSNFMMLNLFVAVILMNFEITEEEKLIKQELNYTRNIEDSEKTDAEKNSALMWLRNRKDSRDPDKLEAMENIRAGIRKAHGEADDDDGADWNRAVLMDFEGEDTALGCLKIDNPLRVFFLAIGDSTTFDMVTLGVIVTSSIALALDKPHNSATKMETSETPLDDNLVIFNLFVTLYFCIEFGIKIIAYGFCFTPRGYIMDSWNVMDFSVLLISVFDAFMTLAGEETNEWTRILRLLRILRPLRLIKSAEGMKVIVNALIKCGPMVLAVGILNMVFYLIFATLGVGMFKGQFLSCSGVPATADWTTLPYYDNVTSTVYTEVWNYRNAELVSFDPVQKRLVESEADLNVKDCVLLGGSWVNPPYNFDNIFQAFKSLFIVSTLEGWIDVMHAGMDCAGEGNAPIKDNQFNNFLFFWGFVILGAYFVTNIFVGVMVNFFSESSGTGLLTHAQKQWQMKQIMCLSVKSRVTVLPEPGPRLSLYNIVDSAPMEYFVQLCIVLNTVVMIAEHFPEDTEVTELFANLNLMFLIIFTTEAALKVFALGPSEYLHDNWCVLDGTIVVMSWIFRMFSQSGASALRSLRILRIILLLKHAPNLKSLFGTLILSLPPCLNLTTLMSMAFFMWGICAVQFFGELPWGDVQSRRDLCGGILPSHEAGWSNPRMEVVAGTTNMTECNWDNACGALGPPECWHPSSWDGMLNKNDNFDDIFNAVALLFQISTGQDWMNMCMEVSARLNDIFMAEVYGASSTWPAPADFEEYGNDLTSFMFFMTFYVAAVFVFLNLFVAVLLENFEMNFESEQLDLNVAHIEQFKKTWTEVTDGPKHESIHISQIRELVEMLRNSPSSPKSPAMSRNSSTDSSGNVSPRTPRSSKKDPSPLITILDDPNWFNRLMFELDCSPDDVNSDMSIGFHQLLLGLTLLQHTYEGLDFETNQNKLENIEARAQDYAANVIGAYIRCWKVTRNVPPVDSLGREYKTEDEKRVYRAAAVCARIMVVDAAVRTNKLLEANELVALVD